jgi:hypothetical protein
MRKSAVIIVIIVSMFSIFIGYRYFRDDNVVVNENAKRFKTEYESLNNKINESNGKEYPLVKITNESVVKYSSYDEILEVLKTGTGVIYLGYPECPWCRTLVPIMLSAASEAELETIYYLNIKEDRDLLMLDSNKEIIVEKEGNKKYFQLVDALSDILEEYVLTDSDGNTVDTGKKRIFVPLLVYVKNGEIIGHHLGTLDAQEDPYVELSDRQQEELLLDLINNFSVVSGVVCDDAC